MSSSAPPNNIFDDELPPLFAPAAPDATQPHYGLWWPKDYVDQVICGDAMAVMRSIPTESVDAVITDPPYGLSNKGALAGFKGGAPAEKNWKWDQYTDEDYDRFTHAYLGEIARVLKKGRLAHIFCGDLYAGVLARIGKVYGLKPKCIVVFRKYNASPSWRMNNRRIVFETCVMLSKGPLATKRFNFLGQREMENFVEIVENPSPGLDFEMVVEHKFPMGRKVTGHDCEKPEAIMWPLIECSTNPGDIVLDCFSGSGTVAVSSKVLGRHYIAIEQEEAFVRDWIIPRLAQAVLFTPEIMQRGLPFDPHALNFGAEDEARREVGIAEVHEAAGRVDAPDDGGSDDEESEIPTPGCHPDEKKQPRNPSIFD